MTATQPWKSPLDRITDDVDELVNGIATTEEVDRLDQTSGVWKASKAKHTVRHPALIDQLSAAVQGSTMALDEAFRPSFGSKPSARLDAIAALQRIETQSKDWAQTLHTRVRAPLKDRLRGLVGGATAYPSLQGDLARMTKSWAVMAKVVTGIESPPFTPDVPCPNVDCEQRGGLRVRLDEKIASCVNCGSVWDPVRIGQFAEYVAWAAEHLRGPRHWVLIEREGASEPEFRECMECLTARQEMADRVVTRRRSA